MQSMAPESSIQYQILVSVSKASSPKENRNFSRGGGNGNLAEYAREQECVKLIISSVSANEQR
jgi:hypothetical protein